MITKRYHVKRRYTWYWLLILLHLPLIWHPASAASRSAAANAARIDAFVHDQVQRQGIPGLALALVEGDQIVHLEGFGTADQTGRAVTPQTPFLLASASKPVTAVALMQLVEAGRVELDAPVQRYLPTFRVADPLASAQITVRQLLLHTSGLPVTACDTRANAETLEQYVAELHTVELDRPVGSRYAYCSGNYNVLGRIIEAVADQSFASYVQQRVFAPLAMRHSFADEGDARRDGLAQGYQWCFGALVPTHYRFNPSQLPSGFLMASAEDMAHFLIAQLNGGQFGNAVLLSPRGIEAMQAPAVAIGAGQEHYGLGWRIGEIGGLPAIYHAGDAYNGHTLLFLQPESRRGAALLMNANGAVAQVAFSKIEAGVARLLAGQEPAPTASLSVPAIYRIIDAVFAALIAVALWPLTRLHRWEQWLRRRSEVEQLPSLPVGLRLLWDWGAPLTLLLGARLFLHALGAQSWREGLSFFPDFGAWLWAIATLMLLTAAARLVLLLRALRQRDTAPQRVVGETNRGAR